MSTDTLTALVRRALREAPCSLRALAREADVPHSTLVRIRGGSLNASPEVADALVKALERWASQTRKLAAAVVLARSKGG
jgi:hypothetical protein